jgi:transmembrane sensor
MADQYLIDLIEKYLEGQCTPAEKVEVEQWYEQYYDGDHVFYEGDTEKISVAAERSLLMIREKLNRADEFQYPNVVVMKPRWNLAWVAASILLVCIGGYFLWPKSIVSKQNVHKLSVENIITPGKNKAILTLSGGKQIILSDAGNGKLIKQGNTQITKTADGQIIYQSTDQDNAIAPADQIVYNTVTTPKGGQYQIVLPDGSHVWLNAASSITYPSNFSGKERLIQLTGEAYFEVAKNPEKPFKVNILGKQQIEVLGTHFDIEAYADDHKIMTTLLEGSVKLIYQNRQAILKPGQIAINDFEHDLIIKAADIEEVMGWKNGLFVLNDTNIKDVMKDASRWYDVDVEYRGNVTNKKLWGAMSRYKNITELLDNIATTSSLHYKIEGRRVILMN